MKESLRNLILLPTLTLTVIAGAILISSDLLKIDITLIYICMVAELIYSWNQNLLKEKSIDFRFFYAYQSRRVITLFFLFSIWTIGCFIDSEYKLLSISFFLVPITYRALTYTGLNISRSSNIVEINEVRSQLDVWDENKKLCKLIIEKYSNIDIVNDLEKSYNYSSFLREKEATELLEKIINSNMNEAEVLLKTLFKKF